MFVCSLARGVVAKRLLSRCERRRREHPKARGSRTAKWRLQVRRNFREVAFLSSLARESSSSSSLRSSLHRIRRRSRGEAARTSSVARNKKMLAKPPSSNGHLARRDRGLLFSGEERSLGGRSFLASALERAPSCRVFFRRPARDVVDVHHHESFPFLDGFFDKAPETTSGSASGWRGGIHRRHRRTRAFMFTYHTYVSTKEVGSAATFARENSILRIIQTCRRCGKDDVRGEKHFNSHYGSLGYSRATEEARGEEKREIRTRGIRE